MQQLGYNPNESRGASVERNCNVVRVVTHGMLELCGGLQRRGFSCDIGRGGDNQPFQFLRLRPRNAFDVCIEESERILAEDRYASCQGKEDLSLVKCPRELCIAAIFEIHVAEIRASIQRGETVNALLEARHVQPGRLRESAAADRAMGKWDHVEIAAPARIALVEEGASVEAQLSRVGIRPTRRGLCAGGYVSGVSDMVVGGAVRLIFEGRRIDPASALLLIRRLGKGPFAPTNCWSLWQ